MKQLKQHLNIVVWILLLYSCVSCSQINLVPDHSEPPPVVKNDTLWKVAGYTSSIPYSSTCNLADVRLGFSGKVYSKDSLGYMSFTNPCPLGATAIPKLRNSIISGNIDFETTGDVVDSKNYFKYNSPDHYTLYLTRLVGINGEGQSYLLAWKDKDTMVWTTRFPPLKTITWTRLK